MRVYRIAKKDFINDLTGEGARLFGGRWNRKGLRVLYTSESRSLATVEYLVHIPLNIMPKDVFIAEIELPEAEFETVDISTLPNDWTMYPAPAYLADIGEKWKRNNRTLGLRIPSAIVKNEWNLLINPDHIQFDQVKVTSIEEYAFDSRLLKRI